MLTSACNVNTGADLEREERKEGGGEEKRGKKKWLPESRSASTRACLPTIVGFDCLTDSLSGFLLLLSIIHSFEKYFFFSINVIRFAKFIPFRRKKFESEIIWFEIGKIWLQRLAVRIMKMINFLIYDSSVIRY